MSSKAAAEALLSYGADLKVKNIVLELVFSALPTVYMSGYKLVDHTDEMIVDLLFQYVKSTLKERKEFGKVSQSLILNFFPNVRVESKTPAEIELYADLVIKKIVYDAVKKIYERFYLEQNNPATKADPGMKKARLIDTLFKPDAAGVKSYFSIEKLNKLSFLNKSGNRKSFKPTSQDQSAYFKEYKYFRSPSDAPQASIGFSNEGNTRYRGATYCFETYVRVSAKEVEDMIACSKDLNLKNPSALANFYREVYKMFMLLGKNSDANAPLNNDPYSETNFKILQNISGMSFVCSIGDLETYYKKKLFPAMQKQEYLSEIYNFGNFLDVVLKGISIGTRLSLDYTSPAGALSTPGGAQINPSQPLSQKLATQAAQTIININGIKNADKTKGFPEKTIYYVEPIVNFNSTQNAWNISFIRHFTTVLSKKEQLFEPKKILVVFDEAKKWNKIKYESIYSNSPLGGTDAAIIEGLFLELLRSKETDALIKSVMSPALLFNTLSLIPNIEIGREIVPLFRKAGVFKGLDDAVNSYISSLENYLSGDFPWLSGCDDIAELF